MRRALLLSLLLAAASPSAWAWGALGHRMVGELAERQLDPKAKAEVAALLAGEPDPTLAGVANWADELRSSDPERFRQTSRWHYINAKGGGCAFDVARDCPDGNCVVAAIEQQRRILGDPNQPLAARRDALKFLVHFVGDVHQPMHAGDRDDAGGNKYQISLRTPIQPEAYARQNYVDGVMGTNLHAIWDYYVLASRGLEFRDYADRLQKVPVPAQADDADPLAWAKESCGLIESRHLYPPGHKLDQRYLEAQRPLAEQRIREAAHRLALLLNQTIG